MIGDPDRLLRPADPPVAYPPFTEAKERPIRRFL